MKMAKNKIATMRRRALLFWQSTCQPPAGLLHYLDMRSEPG
jgi:hypothetical protein